MNLRTKYRCGACKTVHKDEDSAFLCCLPAITEIYECPACGKDHDKRHKAVECCSDPRKSELSPVELEAIGQIRLIP